MGKNQKAVAFAHWLRGQMAEREISQRALGKRLDPAEPERGRRQVVRHLSGDHYPSRPSRRAYAQVLGEEFLDPDDDEPQPVSLTEELTLLVREHRAFGRRLERMLADRKTEVAA